MFTNIHITFGGHHLVRIGGKPPFSYGFTMVFPYFPMVFLWFPTQFPIPKNPPAGLAGDGARLDALGDLWHRDDLLAVETAEAGEKNGQIC